MLIGILRVERVCDVPERHIGALAAGYGAGWVDVSVLQFVGNIVVVTVAESVFQRELAFAFVVAAEQVAVDKTCSECRLPLCHDAAAVLALLEYDVDDARGTAVEVAGAGIVGVFHALDLVGLEVCETGQRYLFAVDLQDGGATVHSDLLQRHIDVQPRQLQHIEQHQCTSGGLYLFLLG